MLHRPQLNLLRVLSCLALTLVLAACQSGPGSPFAFDKPATTPTGNQTYNTAPSQAEQQAMAGNAYTAPSYNQNSRGTPLALGTSSFEPAPPTPGSNTGTYVGLKINQLREDLRKLQSFVVQRNETLQDIRQDTINNSQTYHGIKAAINARLQVGTTRNNPILVQQWNQAQLSLSRINDNITRMNNLANAVASDAAFASFLLDATRATYDLSGAVDEDHRQLAILEDEVTRTVVLVDRLLIELSEDLRRQNNYINGERRDLMSLSLAIKEGELYGGGTTSLSFPTAMSGVQVPPVNTPFGVTAAELASRGEGRPLVVIRFDRPDVEYETALYSAIGQALDRRPEAIFEVVAVTPQRGSLTSVQDVRQNGEKVVRSLKKMGVKEPQITLSTVSSDKTQYDEVRIFVR